jgi:hypothetical protein
MRRSHRHLPGVAAFAGVAIADESRLRHQAKAWRRQHRHPTKSMMRTQTFARDRLPQ